MTNVTASDYRQLDLRFGISYEADLKKAKSIILEILEQNGNIDKDKDYIVFVDDLAERSITMGIRAWVQTSKFNATKWEILEAIKLALDENGIKIPYNQLQVYLDK